MAEIVTPGTPDPEVMIVPKDDGTPVAVVVVVRAGPIAPLMPHAVAGEADVGEKGPNWRSFRRNRTFVDFFKKFMKGELPEKPDVLKQARVKPGDRVYLFDRRENKPAPSDYNVIGWYTTDATGAPEPASFEYNDTHVFVSPDGALSSVLREKALRKAALNFKA